MITALLFLLMYFIGFYFGAAFSTWQGFTSFQDWKDYFNKEE